MMGSSFKIHYGSNGLPNYHRLPKTMPHWFKSNKIKPEGGWKEGRTGRYSNWSEVAPYFIGLNRRWRFGYSSVTGDGWLQVSCPLEHFGRWADSAGPTIPLPKNKKEFDLTIKQLVADSAMLT